ncbi:MAG: metallophosphatase [Enterococcus sp.]
MKYFISDTHYFHESLLGQNDFAPRLFDSVEAMHHTMITNWNRAVKETDTVYHLGDVAMHPQFEKGSADVLAILQQLNGKIIFIKGNHDSRAFFHYLEEHDPKMPDGTAKFAFHDVGAIVKFNHQQYYMTHYPMLLNKLDTICNLHGHIHHYSVPIAQDINVGVDAPERELLEQKLPFGTPLSEANITALVQAKEAELKKIL